MQKNPYYILLLPNFYYVNFRYDPETESIIFAENHSFTKENFKQAGLPSEALFQFCHRMIKMKVDNVEFGLLTAITIFSEGRNTRAVACKKMEKIQEVYAEVLQSYVMCHRKKDPIGHFAKLLGVLVELRSLSNLFLFVIRAYHDLKLANRQLPYPIWNI